jgi:hypothetical protein
MSYSIDGKIANQSTVLRLSGKVSCAKCCKSIKAPELAIVNNSSTKQIFSCASYIGTEHFVYESKSGTAVIYCSEYCRNKHNHRFAK